MFPIIDEEAPDRPRKIIHIDMDAFYASVEQRDNPLFRGKPVAVGRAEERGVVAAASYEARKYGVHSAMPSVTAKRKCPSLIFTPPRFDVYKAISRQIRDIFQRYTMIIEPLSLDEAYLDISDFSAEPFSASKIAEEIREAILLETGLTASAGISYNKLLAKLASDYRKPNGQFVITPKMGPAFAASLPVGKFHGIGPATVAKMQKLGIETGADLCGRPLDFLERHFGKIGRYYYQIARGMDERPVEANRIRKSIGTETTFAVDLFTLEDAKASLAPLIDKLWRHCQTLEAYGRTITIKIKYSDFQQITRSHTFLAPREAKDDLNEAAIHLLSTLFPPPLGIRLLGVSLSSLMEIGEPEQLALPL